MTDTLLLMGCAILISINIMTLYYILKSEKRAIKTIYFVVLIALNLVISWDYLFYSQPIITPLRITTLLLINMVLITAIIDFITYYIFNLILVIYAILGALIMMYYRTNALDMLLGAVSGLILYGLIYLLAKRYYGTEAFGLGDVYFLGAIGLYLGAVPTLITGILAFYFAIIFIVYSKVKNRSTGLKSEIPFGPSIALSAYFMALHYDMLASAYHAFQSYIDHLF